MPGTPPPEVKIDLALAHALLRDQFPELSSLPLRPCASGWDNALYRLGPEHVLRLPRRALAAPLILHEQRWLPTLAPLLPLATPVPTHAGVPALGYPWHWSVCRWIEGETADLHPPDARQGAVLAGFLKALHVRAPNSAPHNPYRGVPLSERAGHFELCLEQLRAKSIALDERHRALWQRALSAPLDAEDTWIHGDLHPRNVLVQDGRLCGVIDWGDVSRGDAATDLATLFMVLPQAQSRHAAMASLSSVSGPTWDRARGWALLFAVILLNAGLQDDPRMSVIAQRTLDHLLEGS